LKASGSTERLKILGAVVLPAFAAALAAGEPHETVCTPLGSLWRWSLDVVPTDGDEYIKRLWYGYCSSA
jgi:hypothetical protein